jgi:hypothetical protein
MTKHPRKRKTKEEKLQDEAYKAVGSFMQHWNMLENKLNAGIETLCDLEALAAATIYANLSFHGKMGVIISMTSLYGGLESKDWRDNARKTFNRCFEVYRDWRNVVAHNVMSVERDGSISILQIRARRELKVPQFKKSAAEFGSKNVELLLLASEIENIINRANQTRLSLKLNKVWPSPPLMGGLFGLAPAPHIDPDASK